MTVLKFHIIISTGNSNGFLNLADAAFCRILFWHHLCDTYERNAALMLKKKGQVRKMSVVIGLLFLGIGIGVSVWRERKAIGFPEAQ